MPQIMYVDKDFRADSLAIIAQADAICANYQAQGYDLTLRQLYYQFVSRAIIANKDTEYKRLGSIINDARLAGMLDWDYITDRTRNMRKPATWDDPGDGISALHQQYREDVWAEQDNYVEVWIEKDALVGVLEQACRDQRVPYFSCRGYTSQSEMWSAAMRFQRMDDNGKRCYILHLGDHDPSGIDMSRDINDRLHLFAPNVVQVNRIALTMAQVNQYQPPPNPAKLTDARAAGYVSTYGPYSWELDALDPVTMTALIQSEVDALIEPIAWQDSLDAEDDQKDKLATLASSWSVVNERWELFGELIDAQEDTADLFIGRQP